MTPTQSRTRRPAHRPATRPAAAAGAPDEVRAHGGTHPLDGTPGPDGARRRSTIERGRRGAERRASAARVGRLAGEQLAVAGGQLGAGVGNLVFALVAARILAPGAFAELAAFLALYLLIHVPAGSLSAGSALSPELAARARRRALAAGSLAGGALAALALPLGSLLDISPLLLVAAAAAAPTAGLLALDRGRLYGLRRRRRVVGSLLAEPAVRLSLGVALAAVAGPVGGAVAVVVAGWAALAVAYVPARETARGARAAPGAAAERHERTASAAPVAAARDVRPGGAVAAFLLLAVVQNQDVLLANALLEAREAGRFAAVSTLGGAAAFATTTVPLMLLGRARGGAAGRDALRAALIVAGLLGLGAVTIVALSPTATVGLVFGDRYASAGAIAVPYLLAMALLGVARVLVAHACANGRARRAIALLVPVALLHGGLVFGLGDDAGGIATATLIATTILTAGAGAAIAARRGPAAAAAGVNLTAAGASLAARGAPGASLALRRALAGAATVARRRDVALVAALAVGGLVLRLLASRGIWLDEATSIHQARMPLDQMLDVMRTTDVHPPLHHVVLWGTVRILGTSELAVRAPSLLAATALIPLLFVVGRDVYDRRAGYAAAALATVAPFAVWYAQEARMYALFMVFALLATWLQIRILRDPTRRHEWLGYVLAAAALVYTQYFGALFVAVQLAAFAIANARGALPLKPALAWTAVLALLIAPLVPFGLDQFAANESAGRGFQQPTQTGSLEPGGAPGAYAALTNVAWAVLGYHSNATMTAIAALWPLGLLLALALLGRGRSWPTVLVVAGAVLPAAGLFALGQFKPFVFEVRYFIGIVPLALLLLARGLTSWARRPAVVGLVCATTVAALALGLADQQLNGSNPRVYDFQHAVDAIEQRARPGDVVVYSPKYVDTVVGYYEQRGLHARPLDDGLPRLRRGQRVFLLASFLDKPQHRRATYGAVRRLDRRYELVRRDAVPQIRTWEFRR